MKILLIIISIILSLQSKCNPREELEKDIYLFSYFIGNGEDGLHLSYSEDGYNFERLAEGQPFLTPHVGKDKLMRDPNIIRGGDGKFHMVWTVSWTDKGLGYASSEDLINWSEQSFIPVMAHEPEARNTWAPEIFYDEEDDNYMIYWSSTIRGKFPETQADADDGYNHRIYYVTTKDFQEFSETKLLYEPGFNVIDGTIIKEDSHYIMFVKDETIEPAEKNIRITKSDRLTGGYSPAGEPITGDYWAEGPTAAKVDGLWVVYFDKYIEKQMGAMASPDLINWTDISDKINFPKGSRHGSVIMISRDELMPLMAQ